MNIETIIERLKKAGKPSTKRIFMNHGAKEPIFGVAVADLKEILKDCKSADKKLALELYKTGISDAMYLAGLIVNGALMTKEEINQWVKKAPWYMISEYVVAKVAAQNKNGMELALEWIKSDKELIASAGWSTLSHIISFFPNDQIDQTMIKKLIDHIIVQIQHAIPRVRYTMNGFIISVGSYMPELTNIAILAAEKIGKITVVMPGTTCKVPDAKTYIEKIKSMGKIGQKKKKIGC